MPRAQDSLCDFGSRDCFFVSYNHFDNYIRMYARRDHIISCLVSKNLKPIYHQNAKLLALGTFASANAKDNTSSGI